jgi:hypothetical protein
MTSRMRFISVSASARLCPFFTMLSATRMSKLSERTERSASASRTRESPATLAPLSPSSGFPISSRISFASSALELTTTVEPTTARLGVKLWRSPGFASLSEESETVCRSWPANVSVRVSIMAMFWPLFFSAWPRLMRVTMAWNAATNELPKRPAFLSSKRTAKPGMAGLGFSLRSEYDWLRARSVIVGPSSGMISSWKLRPPKKLLTPCANSRSWPTALGVRISSRTSHHWERFLRIVSAERRPLLARRCTSAPEVGGGKNALRSRAPSFDSPGCVAASRTTSPSDRRRAAVMSSLSASAAVKPPNRRLPNASDAFSGTLKPGMNLGRAATARMAPDGGASA